jgi:hypothetical protein
MFGLWLVVHALFVGPRKWSIWSGYGEHLPDLDHGAGLLLDLFAFSDSERFVLRPVVRRV